MAESINDTMFLCESCLCVNVNAHAGAQPHTYTAQSVSQQGRQQAEGGIQERTMTRISWCMASISARSCTSTLLSA